MATLANAGGSRRVVDVLAEISRHLLDLVLQTTIATITPVAGTTYTITLPPTAPVEFYLYPGAQIIVDYQGPNEEIATVTAVNYQTGVVTLTLALAHAVGEPIFAATFPSQAQTDPLYTQTEILSYLAQAQNDFLAKVPLILDLFKAVPLTVGNQYLPLPAAAIELERVSLRTIPVVVSTTILANALITQISRSNNVVTAQVNSTEGFFPGQSITISGIADTSFNVKIQLITVGLGTLSWNQVGPNAVSTGIVGGPVAAQTGIKAILRSEGVVTAQVASTAGFAIGDAVTIANVVDNSFDQTVLLANIFEGNFGWLQSGTDTNSVGGTVSIYAGEVVATQQTLSAGADLVTITGINRSAGVVTAQVSGPTDITPGLEVVIVGVNDASFDTAPGQTVEISEVVNFLGQWNISWLQPGPDAVSAGGIIGVPVLTRLYEGSQMQIAALNPQWQQHTGSLKPTHWYEDRTGVYGWGVAPVPRGNFFAELLCSVRDTETLGMLDSFLVPDAAIPYIKYRVMADCLSKSGEQRSPTMASFYLGRYNFGLMLWDRFLRNTVNAEQAIGQMATQGR